MTYIIFKESPAFKYKLMGTYNLKEAREYLNFVKDNYRRYSKKGEKKQAASWSHDKMTLKCLDGGDDVFYKIEKIKGQK